MTGDTDPVPSTRDEPELLRPEHRAYLSALGLTEATIALAGFHSVVDQESVQRLLGRIEPAVTLPALACTDARGRVVGTHLRSEAGKLTSRDHHPSPTGSLFFSPHVKWSELPAESPVVLTRRLEDALLFGQEGQPAFAGDENAFFDPVRCPIPAPFGCTRVVRGPGERSIGLPGTRERQGEYGRDPSGSPHGTATCRGRCARFPASPERSSGRM